MNEMPNARRGPEPAGGGSILLSLVSAALFLYVGFVVGLSGISGNPIYDGSVAAFTWGARVVGIGLLLATAVTALRRPWAAPLDFTLAAIAAAGCLGIGVIWMYFSDNQGLLVILFGLLNASAAKSAWCEWRRAGGLPILSDQAPRQTGGLLCMNPACGVINGPTALYCQRCGRSLRADGPQ